MTQLSCNGSIFRPFLLVTDSDIVSHCTINKDVNSIYVEVYQSTIFNLYMLISSSSSSWMVLLLIQTQIQKQDIVSFYVNETMINQSSWSLRRRTTRTATKAQWLSWIAINTWHIIVYWKNIWTCIPNTTQTNNNKQQAN